MNIRPGSQVRQIVPVIEGTVSDIRWKAEDKQFEVLVSYTDAAGAVQTRWFNENEVAEVPAQEGE